MILFGIRNMLENVPDIVQSTQGIWNIFADIRNVPTGVHCVTRLVAQPSIRAVSS